MHLQWIAWITQTFSEKKQMLRKHLVFKQKLEKPISGKHSERTRTVLTTKQLCQIRHSQFTHITKISEESLKSSWSKKYCVKCRSCSSQTWLWAYNPSSIPSNQAPAVSHTRHPLWTLTMLFITALQTCAVSCILASPLPLGIASHIIN